MNNFFLTNNGNWLEHGLAKTCLDKLLSLKQEKTTAVQINEVILSRDLFPSLPHTHMASFKAQIPRREKSMRIVPLLYLLFRKIINMPGTWI